MAKKEIRQYTYYPAGTTGGGSNYGVIKIPGSWDFSKILLITNVTRGVILFNFADINTTQAAASIFTKGGIPTQAGDQNTVVYLQDAPFGTTGSYNPGSYSLSSVNNTITGIGETTINLSTNINTAGHSSTDKLSIFVEEGFQYVRPWGDFGTDAIERARVATPQSMIDADFEYGLQPTKWQGVEMVNQYASIYELPGTDLPVFHANIWGANAVVGAVPGGTSQTLFSSVLVNTFPTAHGLSSNSAIIVQNANVQLYGFPKVTGGFIINSVLDQYSFQYYAKGNVGSVDPTATVTNYTGTGTALTGNPWDVGYNIIGPQFYIRKGGYYSQSALPIQYINSDGARPRSNIQVYFGGNLHGFAPGMPLVVYASPSYQTGTYANLAGAFYTNALVSNTQISFQAMGYVQAGGNVQANASNGIVGFVRSDGYFTHRPGDGGIVVATQTPIHGAAAVRQTKKYFRYQSGKGMLYTTGVLFAPQYDIVSIQNIGTTNGAYNPNNGAGGILKISTQLPHGLQPGATVRVVGVQTFNVDGQYNVDGVIDDNTIFCYAVNSNMGTAGYTSFGNGAFAYIGGQPKLYIYKWNGASVRTGPHDDANGMFWEYDGQYFYVARRTSINQIAGTHTFTPGSTIVTGQGSTYTNQLHQGDKIVIKGMVHKVASVVSDTQISVTPSYRGSSATSGNFIYRVQTIRTRQDSWNRDTVDGSGNANNPSGYFLDPNRMQMIGIQFTWYGAGFMDYMVRGHEANMIIVHRYKNNNVNVTASMRSANLPARYTVINEPPNYTTFLTGTSIGAADTSIDVADASYWPSSGTVIVGTEIIKYTNITAPTSGIVYTLTGLTRGATANVFLGGQYRNFYGSTIGTGNVHVQFEGVEIIGVTATPTMTHWGSSYVIEGMFDFDRGYMFNYTQTGLNINTVDQSIFAVRLAPSASQGVTGDLGDREVINRAQFMPMALEVVANVGNVVTYGGGIQVTGVLNPSNFPGDGVLNFSSLNSTAYGNQPSFAQANLYPGQGGLMSGNVASGGERVFQFVASTDTRNVFDLSGLKELSQGIIGGRGTYPNGPDTLFINMKALTAANLSNVSVSLRWNEGQA